IEGRSTRRPCVRGSHVRPLARRASGRYAGEWTRPELLARAACYRRTMIPYDDLVAALQAWRARQGLPVSTVGGSGSGATPVPSSNPGSGRTPPAPPPGRPGSEAVELDEGAMLEEQYDNEGQDFAMGFGNRGNGDSTAVGGAPQRPSDRTDPGPGRGGNWG